MDVLNQSFLEENTVRLIEQEKRYVLSQGVRMGQEYKVINVHHMVVEKDVLNQDVVRGHKEIPINVVHMAVEDDVQIVSIGLIHGVEVCAMIGIVQHVSNDFSQMIHVLK
jgi:hypothetical protein